MSSSRIQFDIESGVSYTEDLDHNGLRVHMYFLDREIALKHLQKLKLELDILILSHSVDLDGTIDLTDDNPRIISEIPAPDTIPCQTTFDAE